MKKFIKICKMEQMKLKEWLDKALRKRYDEVINEDGFLYAKGNIPVLLTAHMDTVHKETCSEVVISMKNNETIISSPQGIGGDDRCGVWIIWKLLKETKLRPYILFCEDEEIGGVGSNKFVATEYIDGLKEMKYLVELDRANYADAVFYDCGNKEFKEFIETETGYKEAYGSFSDIGHLSPKCDVASVNLSCGYYKAHTTDEYVVFEEMEYTKDVVYSLLSNIDKADEYDYQEDSFDSMFSGFWKNENSGAYGFNLFEITYRVEGKTEVYETEGDTFEEAIGTFLINNPDLTFNSIVDIAQY